MVKSIIWSEESIQDIDSIAEFISRDSAHHAQRVVGEIFNIAETLLSHPEMGRIVPELRQSDTREHFIYSYRIIYEIKEEQLHILAMIHGSRLLENIGDRFDE